MDLILFLQSKLINSPHKPFILDYYNTSPLHKNFGLIYVYVGLIIYKAQTLIITQNIANVLF